MENLVFIDLFAGAGGVTVSGYMQCEITYKR